MTVLLSVSCFAQEVAPSKRPVEGFGVHGASRLAALARVGALTHTSLLVEAGEMKALQAYVHLDVGPTTVSEAVDRILGGGIPYTLREEGQLLIVFTATVRDRMLDLSLGSIRFSGGGYPLLEGLLQTATRGASGCALMGTAWAGPVIATNLPPIQMANATFERVVARTAEGPEAAMWIVQTRARPSGCLEDPSGSWQFGIYGFGAGGSTGGSTCQRPFSSSSGPQFLEFAPKWHAFPEPCKGVDLHGPKGPPVF